MKDQSIVTLEKIRQRDPQVIAELVRTHHRPLRGYVAALSADVDAVEDLAQEVFVRALQRLDRVAVEDFGRFLRGIARNVVREHGRWRSRHAERFARLVEQTYDKDMQHLHREVEDPGVVGALRNCVGKLPARSRRMLMLRYWEEKRAEEIGREIGLNGGAVRIALLRIREALIECIRSVLGKAVQEAQT